MSSLPQDLLSNDSDLRTAALQAAAQSSDPQIPPLLVSIIRDPNTSESSRHLAAEALALSPLDSSPPQLLSLIQDPDPLIRGAAAVGLLHWKSPESVAALLHALQDKQNTVRNLAERSLLQLTDLLAIHGVETLLLLLKNPIPLTRSPAARLIGLTRAPQALDPLLHLLKNDKQWLVRMWAAKGLGDLGLTDAAHHLAHSLRHDEKNRVRAAAAEAIGKLRPDQAQEWLLLAAKDEDGGVRKIAQEALMTLGFADFSDSDDEPAADD